ncbi:MAG: hypothetical protein K9J30_04940 [Bacteroidales bacterium]|nr:hypothetical protein [Bacteroidales bacterium]
MKRSVLITGILFVILNGSLGQGIIIDEPKMLFNNEQTLGAFLNSNGFGADFRYARFIDARNDRIFDAAFNYIKHPKEYQSVVTYEFYTERFVYGKKNLFWEIQGQIGNQHELFRKYDFSSISIRLNYTGGFSIGFLKPIYYDIITYNSTGGVDSTSILKFDPSIHLYNYGGKASFTYGLSETKIIPGVTVKVGFSFEYSEKEPVVHALDAGLGITVYPKNIEIMDTDVNHYLFFKMYVGYRFGTMIDISEAASARSKKQRRKELREAMKDAQIPLL